jgi:tetratricopeptide (TPR) repeat protein
MNKDKNESAIKKLKALLPDLPSSNERFAVLFFIAFCYSKMELYSEAIEVYTVADEIKTNSTLLSNLGRCYNQIGDFESALGAYEDAINVEPSNPFPYNNIAQLLIQETAVATSPVCCGRYPCQP